MTEEQLLLLDVLYQECYIDEDSRGRAIFDNMCMATYEGICSYLTRQGILTGKNGRIYYLKKKYNTN
jgi:hypothetical protein